MSNTENTGPKLKREALIALAKGWKGPVPIPAAVKKEPVGVEDVLRWAYREELPKTPREISGPMPMAGGWEQMAKWAEELPLAGLDQNRFGVVPEAFSNDAPHPDAFVVHEAMAGLESLELEFPDGWNPLADLPSLGSHAHRLAAAALDHVSIVGRDGKRMVRDKVARRLVFRHAIMGGCPDWEIAPDLVVKPLTKDGKVCWFRKVTFNSDGAFGPASETIEVDGFNSRAGRPYYDAYTREVVDPDPFWQVVGRAEYEIWRAALDIFAEDLRGAMASREVILSSQPRRPWETGPAEAPRVLRAIVPTEEIASEIKHVVKRGRRPANLFSPCR